MERLLLFGASGAIGGAILSAARSRDWQVTAISRNPPDDLPNGTVWIATDPLQAGFSPEALAANRPYSSVCWAQGANHDDSVYDLDIGRHLEMYKANVTYILITLHALLQGNLLAQGSRMCVISSIWQQLARQSKLSYCVSKAALHGLVLSAAADMAADGHLINAVLPGALDTPMTRGALSAEQIDRLSASTNFGKLPRLRDVASLVCFLCSAENTGITGQFIAVDLGYSHVRIV
jgi:NAD(P)-dependent dehydrogenase (short-subunit alcohol dehydrogenase family)